MSKFEDRQFMKVSNHFDATLVQLLSALCTRRDIAHVPDKLAQKPFDHILGTLGRGTLSNAIKKDRLAMRRYRLHERWNGHFKGARWVEDHVYPLHQWKAPLLAAATAGRWQVDEHGLQGLREFVDKYYMTAFIPDDLHRTLSRHTMPEGWVYVDSASLWSRYTTEKVSRMMGKKLVLPDHDRNQSDFVSAA
jgi:hypothetical protein